MARLFQSLVRAFGLTSPGTQLSQPSSPSSIVRGCKSIDADFSVFQQGDRAIIHGKHPILTKPLRSGHKTDVRRGYLEHDKIIGQKVYGRFQAYKGSEYRVSLPTLDEYVALTPRCVTPIYSADANLIVSLLDIHVTPAAAHDPASEPLEILESGTGHGSLTLHLARAIQAANTVPPPLPSRSQITYLKDRPRRPGEEEEEDDDRKGGGERGLESAANATTAKANEPDAESNSDIIQQQQQQQWDEWRAIRNAIIHTVDVSPKFSAHAEKIVRGFRRGMYAGNVDFYVGAVENWISDQITRRSTSTSTSSWTLSSLLQNRQKTQVPFLTYAILDMPSAHLRIPHVAPILKTGGILAVFMPSVTQIGECVKLIKHHKLPFRLEKAVELGMGISSGRLWDVKLAVKKSRADPSSWTEVETKLAVESGSELGSTAGAEEVVAHNSAVEGSDVKSLSGDESVKEEDGVLVCRPMVGLRIVGGGFVGIWRRIEDLQERGD